MVLKESKTPAFSTFELHVSMFMIIMIVNICLNLLSVACTVFIRLLAVSALSFFIALDSVGF